MIWCLPNCKVNESLLQQVKHSETTAPVRERNSHEPRSIFAGCDLHVVRGVSLLGPWQPNTSHVFLRARACLWSFYHNHKPVFRIITFPLLSLICEHLYWASPMAQQSRICSPMQEMWVRSPSQEDSPLSILAQRVPWTEEPGGLQSTGSEESGTQLHMNTHGIASPDGG